MGVVKTTQGNGGVDNTAINRTQIRVSASVTQGTSGSNGIFLGSGDTVGPNVTPPGGSATGIYNGPVLLAQGTGSDDYIGVENLTAGVVSLLQQDLATNATGDQVGGEQTNEIPPASDFGDTGLDAPTTSTTGLPNEAGGPPEAEITFLRTVPADTAVPNPLGITAPVDGFRNALLEQLNITEGSAAGDIIALVQLAPNLETAREVLSVPGAPFIPGVSGTPGTVTLLQQDLAGATSDYIFMGSYNLFNFHPPRSDAAGFVTANNYVVAQGTASGDILSVIFTAATSLTTALSSLFLQGNGGDDAFFQFDTATAGGLFNYAGGSGGNYVQADANYAICTFDDGSNVAFNVLGQFPGGVNVPANQSVLFVDFGSVIVA
jgi:hypothetical protein